jgi:hypothetical protein
MVLGLFATLRAIRHAARKATLFYEFQASGVVGKLFIEIPYGVSKRFRDVLFYFHNGEILSNPYTCCQGILTRTAPLTAKGAAPAPAPATSADCEIFVRLCG